MLLYKPWRSYVERKRRNCTTSVDEESIRRDSTSGEGEQGR